MVDGLPRAAPFALGAIVAPIDLVGATAIARRLALPRRITNNLGGEGLLKDGTALLAYRAVVPPSAARCRRWARVWTSCSRRPVGCSDGSTSALFAMFR